MEKARNQSKVCDNERIDTVSVERFVEMVVIGVGQEGAAGVTMVTGVARTGRV